MEVKVINKSNYRLPEYATNGSAGLDLKADILESITLRSLERAIIPTNLHTSIPDGYVLDIRPRSGLAAKNGITVLNAPGTIDSDYTGNIGVILINLSNTPFTINPGDRIAQAVLLKYERIEWKEVDTLDATERGEGGFGHSGIK